MLFMITSCKRTIVKYYLPDNYEGIVIKFYTTSYSDKSDWTGRVIEYKIPQNGILMLGERPYDKAYTEYYYIKKNGDTRKIQPLFGDVLTIEHYKKSDTYKKSDIYRYFQQGGGAPMFFDDKGKERLTFSYDYFVISKDSNKIIPYLE